jgi:hypothetical protein
LTIANINFLGNNPPTEIKRYIEGNYESEQGFFFWFWRSPIIIFDEANDSMTFYEEKPIF